MDPHHATIPIHCEHGADATDPGQGCAACPPHGKSTPCFAAPDPAGTEEAQLIGPADELQRVLGALGHRLGFSPEAPALGGVRSLRLAPGEAELRLAWPSHCAGTERADTAFDTLRSLLPDTDIYVTRAA